MIMQIVKDIGNVSPPLISAMFHNTVAHAVSEMCVHVGNREKISIVALSGGVFQNRLLLELLLDRLKAAGFRVFWNNLVSPNDSGIALGQAAVARARIYSEQGTPCASQYRVK